jgi:hypothetical protein
MITFRYDTEKHIRELEEDAAKSKDEIREL